ncbi:hypothetical protein MSPP1_002590 [Malassezia sp. CBS 17886]|nr:hypothetical protein MSPP1_002590 [Malassezia sp. CBS 17886]
MPAALARLRYFPTCFSALWGSLPLPPAEPDKGDARDAGAAGFPNNIRFVVGDWVAADKAGDTNRAIGADDARGYDLILCFSLTKWVHLNQGDAGLVRFFARIAACLREGGIVALEVQPWRSYDQARSVSKEIRSAYTRLALLPNDFDWVLTHVLRLTRLGPVAEGTGFGFRRPVVLYRKWGDAEERERRLDLGANPVDMKRRFADELWSKDQQKVMETLGNAVVGSLNAADTARLLESAPPNATPEQLAAMPAYARLQFSDVPGAVHLFGAHVLLGLPAPLRTRISLLLYVLSTRLGTLALTGHVGPLWMLDRDTLRDLILSWQNSSISLLRQGALGIRGLVLIVVYRHSSIAATAMGYPLSPASDWQTPPDGQTQEPCEPYRYNFLNERLPQPRTNTAFEVTADVVVVGSGSGGGVVASYLAARGVHVIVVDKGIYVPPEEMDGTEDNSYATMYDGLGLIPSADGSLFVISGSGFGGGTAVNWSATLKPRFFLRSSWARKHGLPYFATGLFTQDLDACIARMGADTDHIQHNRPNTLLALGAQRAGQPVNAVPQNTGGHAHYCGKCHLGCRSGHKQGGVAAWLRDAAEHRAEFLTHYDVQRVTMKDGRATGVVGSVGGQRVVVHARKAVVSSAGSLHTPALLLRTPQLRSNKQIGQHLRLHPTAMVQGYYEFPIKPWEGGILTTVSNAAEMADPHGWGAKLEVIASSPGLFAPLAPWNGVQEHKERCLRYPYSYTIIIVTRDRDGGSVTLDSEGKPQVNYSISKHDQKGVLEGILRATEIHMSAGASELTTSQVGLRTYTCPADKTPSDPANPDRGMLKGSYPFETLPPQGNTADASFLAWQDEIRALGTAPLHVMLGSAHQMSSCRMGMDPKRSACDHLGRVRGASNLWVADGSSVPESTGVNPMLTIMGTARGIARNIAADIGVEAADPLPPPAHFPVHL